MSDVDHVVEFSPAADDGIPAYALIDGAERTDLHIAFNDDAPAAFQFIPHHFPGSALLEVKRVCPDDGAGVDDNVITDLGMVVDNDIGVNDTITADGYVMPDNCAMGNNRSFANHGAVAHPWVCGS